MSVAERSVVVLAMDELRRLPSTLMGGTEAMRGAGRTYLPQEVAESNAAYKNRVNRSFLFNGYGKTVRDMASKVFETPIILSEKLNSDLTEDAKNIDLTGRSLSVFAHAVFIDGLSNGVTYILVDMDKPALKEDGSPAIVTKADEVTLNRRPWAVHIFAHQVLGWRSELVSGVEKLTQFRFMETVTEDDSQFGEVTIEQVRVFDRLGTFVTWSTYRRNNDNVEKWTLHESGVMSLTNIPIVAVYMNRTGFMQGAPTLSDLAEVNQAHWQSQSDQRNILHVARVPILFGSGFEEKKGQKFEIGGSRMITVSDSKATLKYVEHTGAAIDAGRVDLKDLEFQMQVLGLELLIPRPGGETATGAAIDQAKMNTPLSMMAIGTKNGLEIMFGFMSSYRGLNPELVVGTVDVNTDFGVSLRGVQDVTALITMVEKKIITSELCIGEMKRRSVLSENVNAAEEVERVLLLATSSFDDGEP